MPLYDFVCPSGHKFEKVVPIAQRNEPVACHCGDKANRIEISHSNPRTMLDYGLGINREAALKGTFDPKAPPLIRGVRRGAVR